ncbi:MAG: pentapeptide repeat-containing protein [gamma proteobacterium symbiont of Bathyaustriella thionipta]|nr:pentapeptide repeat-containing protein [gamma proteobacterium symbiont of Bathyaustriella thionipta]MCU7951361.1 pentapeptide repeat-containing protein [gamma proteobacterium symbiont of Bathyaustriella thionipta]MCU7954083.1 pentapeptide repeat-containing protein [gamma proteobacterium symbiont of Bathyaustriella thionipta]MCU7957913.1 pentapeptide repeat-containing protein [gamma proteobacterium symbiont of Bathyaustriella thionipta]MCU7968350.1 pentapeptide repeat-containing protein [gamm
MGGGKRKTPVPIEGLGAAIAIVSNDDYTLALRADGTVWQVGRYYNNGRLSSRKIPTQISGLENITRIAAGAYYHFIALKNDGTVWTWGDNKDGQLGDGTDIGRNNPKQVQGVNNIVAIATGNSHTIALNADGTVFAWGANNNNQMGDPRADSSMNKPRIVKNLSDIVDITAGMNHSLAIHRNGSVYLWGEKVTPFPVKVEGLTNVIAVAAGSRFSFAITADGAVWEWYSGYKSISKPSKIIDQRTGSLVQINTPYAPFVLDEAAYAKRKQESKQQACKKFRGQLLNVSKKKTNTFVSHDPSCGGSLAGKNLSGFNFKGADLRGVDFTDANLYIASFKEANLSGVNFSNVRDLSQSHFEGANLRGANFSGADLMSVHFNNADLREANFSGANISSNSMIHVNLHKANFDDAKIQQTNIQQSDLSQASFRNAEFTERSYITMVDINGADFTGARIPKSFFHKRNNIKNIDKAIGIQTTTQPVNNNEYFTREAQKMELYVNSLRASEDNPITGAFGLTLGQPFNNDSVSKVITVKGTPKQASYYVIPHTSNPYFSTYRVIIKDGFIKTITASSGQLQYESLGPGKLSQEETTERCEALKTFLTKKYGATLNSQKHAYYKSSENRNIELNCSKKRVDIIYGIKLKLAKPGTVKFESKGL